MNQDQRHGNRLLWEHTIRLMRERLAASPPPRPVGTRFDRTVDLDRWTAKMKHFGPSIVLDPPGASRT